MYASLALAVTGLATSSWRRRSVAPLALALAGGTALLLAFHESWDVTVFSALAWAGAVALAAAVAWDLILSQSVARHRTEKRTCGT
jgi:hypothetical protein